jgi:hypothetical protein
VTEPKALAQLFDRSDAAFFVQHRDRKAHIRKPYIGEHEIEFQWLGWHDKERRHILLCRVDYEGKPLPDNKVLKVPFLAFADETIEDRDDILLPIINEIMYGRKAEMQQ